MATAKKETLKDANIKLLIWGKAGAGKSRFGLTAPSPLVIDYEGSTRLYVEEFDFLAARIDPTNENIGTPIKLTMQVIKEFINGEYPDIKTIVIDPVTDLLDEVEKLVANEYEKKLDKKIANLSAIQKSQYYAFRKTKYRNILDKLKDLPVNLILVARSKLIWDKVDGKMQPVGDTYDAHEIVESLMDMVIELEKKSKVMTANITKSRVGDLPESLEIKDYTSILQALTTPKNEISILTRGEIITLYEIGKKHGFNNEEVKALMNEMFCKVSSKTLTVDEYLKLIAEIKKVPVAEVPNVEDESIEINNKLFEPIDQEVYS